MEHFEWYEEESVDTTGICTSLLVLHYNIYGTPLFNELMQTKEGRGGGRIHLAPYIVLHGV